NLDAQVNFRGWVSSAAVNDVLLRSKVGLLPLRRKHPHLNAVGSPLKLFEYAAAGLRVVGTNVDGISNAPVQGIVHHYALGDVEGCAAAMVKSIRANAYLTSDESWSWHSRAAQILAL